MLILLVLVEILLAFLELVLVIAFEVVASAGIFEFLAFCEFLFIIIRVGILGL